MKKRRDTGRYPVKLGNGTMLSVKAENMRREGTKGAEGKNKGNERKELELKRRSQRKQKKKIRSAHTHWMKDTAHKPYLRQGQEGIISANRKVVELPSARELRKICSQRNSKRKVRTGSINIYPVSYTHCTPIDSVREDRDKQKFRSRGDKIIPSKRNLKRKSRKGSTDVFLLERTIELEID